MLTEVLAITMPFSAALRAGGTTRRSASSSASPLTALTCHADAKWRQRRRCAVRWHEEKLRFLAVLET